MGIPHLATVDPYINEKMKYLKSTKASNASTWRFTEVSKAINQSLGRVVRHTNDYGSIILIDKRYITTNNQSKPVVQHISEWIKKEMEPSKSIK